MAVSMEKLLVVALLCCVGGAVLVMGEGWDGKIVMPTAGDAVEGEKKHHKPQRWAVLVAGSAGYVNYRHQADVCHAYQVLKNGGMKDENIVVFMFDDIAHDPNNPRPGTIINHPLGADVYHGVPKDYTGKAVTVDNLFAVILGDKKAVNGGSGKVVDSGPDDHIFIYYADHGGPGVLGMPNTPFLYADDLIDTLKKKHKARGYKEMVIYIEACESGSIFQGLLPAGLNIYATTASNAVESSWGTYCPGMTPAPPEEFDICLGDLYSVAWMEDADIENLKKETLRDQYLIVKSRTSNHKTYETGSHVMEFGDLKINVKKVDQYLGYNPANENASSPILPRDDLSNSLEGVKERHVSQRDADLVHFWHKYHRAKEGSPAKAEAGLNLMRIVNHRVHIDKSVELVGKLLFGASAGPTMLTSVRSQELPLVDDWSCLKSMVRVFESSCGLLTQYGMKHMRAFANICNAGVDPLKMGTVAAEACAVSSLGSRTWQPLTTGFSA
ncbi:hypothetical protein M758_6G136500 [Ceratodon purpureus]|nr:hypothetical protein M758_6G136500 [Ceratodon purpureus]